MRLANVMLNTVLLVSGCAGAANVHDVEDSDVEPTNCPGGDAWYLDADGDTYGVAGTGSCAEVDGWVKNALDCDDTDDAVHPEADETCNNVDDDCDDLVDDADGDLQGDMVAWPDTDGDGFGNEEEKGRDACQLSDTETDNDEDCNDSDPDVFPGALDVPCDGEDSDCDKTTPASEVRVPGDSSSIQDALDDSSPGDWVCHQCDGLRRVRGRRGPPGRAHGAALVRRRGIRTPP